MSNGFAHLELSTGDPAKAQKFYKTVLPSWKFTVGPGLNYTMIDTGQKGGARGGMMKKPMPEAPTQWLPYIAVDDVKKTIAKARKAGARIMLEFHDIGDMGSIGVFLDPTGAACGVWATKKEAPKKAAPRKAAKKASPKKAVAKGKKR